MATAFTSVQKAKLRLYLGWSARFHQFDSRLEQAFSAIDSEADDSTHDLIVGVLAQVEDIGTRITAAYGRLKAMKVGSIDLPGANELALLRAEGRRYVGQIASTLGVEVRHDVFKAGSPRAFAGFNGLYGGGSNELKYG